MKLFSLNSLKISIFFTYLLGISFLFLPFTASVYTLPKWWFLLGTTGFILVLTSLELMKHKHISIALTPQVTSLVMLALAGFASSFLASQNVWEALSSPFGPLTFLALAMLYAIGLPYSSKKTDKILVWILFAASAFLSLIALYQALGIGKMLANILPQTANPLFTPVGSPYALLAIFSMLLPSILATCINSLRDATDTGTKHWIALILISIGITTTIWKLFGSPDTHSLPLSAAWAILLEQFKRAETVLLGVGPANFLSAFIQDKPIWINSLPSWNTRYDLSANFPFHLATTLGLLGVVAVLSLMRTLLFPLYVSISQPKNRFPLGLTISMTIGCIGLFLSPPNIAFLSFLLVIMSLCFSPARYAKTIQLPNLVKRSLAALGLFALGIACIGYSSKTIIADYYFYRGLHANETNNGNDSYLYLSKAVFWNAQKPDYRIMYSQANAAIADALIAKQSQLAENTSPTDEDRQTIGKIIQQAVREAKIAVDLAPKDVRVWENLARLYSAIAPVTQGADTWIESSYQKALSLDPTNPALFTEYGNYLFAKKQIDPSLQAYIRAIDLKPNYPDAHYNIGFILQSKRQYAAAAQAFTTALALTPNSKPEYSQIQNQLSQVKQLLTPQELENLTAGKAIDYTQTASFITTPAQPSPVVPSPEVGVEEQVNERLPEASPSVQ